VNFTLGSWSLAVEAYPEKPEVPPTEATTKPNGKK
jgi:hypothetical protein